MSENDLIKLSSKQRANLIEILNHIYPNANVSISDFGRIVVEQGNKIMQVHWFEACFTIIPIMMSKVSKDWRYYCDWMVANMTSKINVNPIDYLYEQFLLNVKENVKEEVKESA